jgi:transcriptional regulator with GAF, ATPase, and Fis domain
MAPKVWLQEAGVQSSDYRAGLSSALQAAGVELAANSDAAGTHGVLIASREGDPELAAQVGELSRHGLVRVVVVVPRDAVVMGTVAWPLRRAGAVEVLADGDPTRVARALAARAARWSEVDLMMASPVVSDALIGGSPSWVLTLRQIVEAAAFTEGSLLLLGESGTGKEMIARVVHALDRRPGLRSLVVLDCTTVVPDLAGSEFFGHEKGAFTGATATRDGSFALADGGTLFLDEVGELPLPMQAQLLRVVQERTYKRVGGNEWLRANFRLIAATNRNLDQDVVQGGFRRDLFHRIASRVYRIPPLRERAPDILLLAKHFLGQLRPGTPPVVFEPAVRELLLARSYPGNVRELKQLVCRIADRWVGAGPVTVGAIPPDEVPASPTEVSWRSGELDQAVWRALQFGVGLHEIKEAAGARAFALALEMESGSTRGAASRLAVTERTVQTYRADCRAVERSS